MVRRHAAALRGLGLAQRECLGQVRIDHIAQGEVGPFPRERERKLSTYACAGAGNDGESVVEVFHRPTKIASLRNFSIWDPTGAILK